jgi:hypothetical protein
LAPFFSFIDDLGEEALVLPLGAGDFVALFAMLEIGSSRGMPGVEVTIAAITLRQVASSNYVY